MIDSGSTGGFRRDALQLSAARLSSVAALFGVNVAAARLLEAQAVGAVAVGQTVGLLAAMLANGGLNISTIFFLRRPPTERDTVAGALLALAGASCAVAILAALASAPIVFATVLGSPDWALLLAAALMAAGMIAFEFTGAVLLAIDRVGRFTLQELGRGWGSLAAVILALVVLPRPEAVLLGLAVGYAAGAALGWVWSRRTVRLVPRVDAAFSREALAFGLRGQAGNILQYVGLRLDLLLVPAFLTLQAGGLYFVAVRVSDAVGQIGTAASSLLFPRVAAEDDRSETRLTERVARMTILGVAVVAALIGVAADPLLRVVFGGEYATGATALQVLLAGVVPLSLCRVLVADLKGRGRPGLASLGSMAMAVATVALDIVLIPAWGLVGAAVASLLGYGLGAVALAAAYHRVTHGALLALVPRWSDVRELTALVGYAWRARAAE